MPFFQNSVINKYIQNLDKQTIHDAYDKFRSHFHNAIIQENIRGSKEEQYQGEFLIDLFVNVLGYTKNPTPNFNLTTEYKNVKDSKKADGAIIINEVVKAVIELKGTNTTDLNKIETQAFGYKNNQPECEYVITSNFEKIRFYIDNAIEYIEFNLFTLTEKEFELLYICLSYDSIAKGLPKQLKDESVSQEDLITKKLYKDYSVFKSELYHSLVKLNPQYNPLELFKKSQKLLDRFLFIFFAEDRQLLPTNLIFRINKEWQQLREMRIEVSLYDRYKIYFNDLDLGARVSLPAFSQTASKQKEEFEIYAYNGGLFKKDDLLNDIKIEDDLLFLHTEKLSNYDFASEVDVNVLGHIFENSLNDVDEIKAQLEGQEIDKTKTKRKKDGVFYTPKYITKYIVDNTVGKLCLEKKEALQLTESDYTIDKKRPKKTTQALTDRLNEYRNWLLQLTICDPACGSGAFLNQALDFLITEHRYIDELQAKLFGDAIVLSDVEGSILENNLFGVDINEESVEIAKLSLWLRTAQPNRKLNDLNSNIKCGNSLIDDVAVAGDKAFNWEQEFPQVFQNAECDKKYVNVETRLGASNIYATKDSLGDYKDDSYGLYNEFHEPKFKYKLEKEKKHGFDVVIGNPPYGAFISKEIQNFYTNNYVTAKYKLDTYAIFIEKGINITKGSGQLSYIVPYTFLTIQQHKKLREFILNYSIETLVDLPTKVFESADLDTVILTMKKTKPTNKIDVGKIENESIYLFNELTIKDILNTPDFQINLNNSSFDIRLINKIKNVSSELNQYCEVSQGLIPYDKYRGHDEFTIKNRIWHSDFCKDETYKKELKGDDISRYNINWNGNLWVSYGDWLAAPRHPKFFNSPRIIIMEITRGNRYKLSAVYLEGEFYNTPSIINIISRSEPDILKSILLIINSRLMTWYHLKVNPKANAETSIPKILVNDVRNLPIPKKKSNQFTDKADHMLFLNKELQEISQKFQRILQRKFNLHDLPKKLKDWYLLSYSDFIKELAKKKIKLSLSDEAEWEEYFNTESKKALEVKSKIDATDKEIDQLVYTLYELTDEEIKIVEG